MKGQIGIRVGLMTGVGVGLGSLVGVSVREGCGLLVGADL